MLGGNALGWAYLGRGYAGTPNGSGVCTLTLAANAAAEGAAGSGAAVGVVASSGAHSGGWTGPLENVEFAATSSGTTLTFSPVATIPAGTFVLIAWAANIAATVNAGAGDNSTQAGAANVWTRLGGTVSTPLSGSSVYCLTTRDILPTDVITLTLSSAATRRNGRLVTFLASGPLDGGLNVTNVTSSPISIGPMTPSGSGELAVGISFWLGGAVLSGFNDTTTGYTKLAAAAGSGGSGTRVEANLSFKPTAGLSSETDSHSFTSLTDASGQILAFQPALLSGSGTVVIVAAPTGGETIRDAGALSFTVAPSGADGVGDAATQTALIVASGVEAVGGSAAAAVVTVAITPTSTEAIREAGTLALTLAPSGSEILPDAGSATLAVTTTTGDALRDSGSPALTLATGGAEAISDTSSTVQVDRGATGVLGGLMLGEYPRAARFAVSQAIVITGGTGSAVIIASDPHAFAVVQGQAYLYLAYPDDLVYPDDIAYPDAIPYGGDGILDVGTAAVVVLASGTQSVTGGSASDTGLVAPTILTSGIEAASDAATDALSIAGSSVEAQTDAGTGTLVIAPSDTVVATDSGSLTLVIAPTGGEYASDAGVATFALVPSSAEQVADATATLVAVAASGSDAPADATSTTLAITASAVELASEAATVTISIAPTRDEAFADSTTDTLVIDATAVAGVLGASPSDLGTVTIVVTPSTFDVMAQGLTFSTIQPAGAEQLADAGSVTLGIASSGAEAAVDAAADALSITASGTASVTAGDAATLVVANASSEALSESGTQTGAITLTGADSPAEAVTAILSLAAASVENVAATALVSLVVTPASSEVLSDAAGMLLIITPLSGDQQSDTGSDAFTIQPTGTFSLTAGNANDQGAAFIQISTTGLVGATDNTLLILPTGADSISETGACTIRIIAQQVGNVLVVGTIENPDPSAGITTCPTPVAETEILVCV